MLRLEAPSRDYDEALEICFQGITGNKNLLKKMRRHKQLLLNDGLAYNSAAASALLYTLPSIPKTKGDVLSVLGQLNKKEILSLYSTYFAPEKKPARAIYDELMAAANEKCPFCGGVGRPRNLDHYLPKSRFPTFAVLLVNLVPSCRDCNMDGKGEGVATDESDQVLHPYLDDDRYFNEQWLFAKYTPGIDPEPGVIEYFVQAPEHWEEAQKQRVVTHFDDFDLGLRFSKEAAPRLTTYLAQIKSLTDMSIDLAEAKRVILGSSIDLAPFVNYWERVMCLAIMHDLAD